MTKRERAQVVELLRCAADRGGMLIACLGLGLSSKVYRRALDACKPVDDAAYAAARCCCVDVWPYVWRRLEAAARVEQGEWP